MGTNSSKAVNGSSTILQSPNKEEAFSDPRSPTPEIIRTPLKVNGQCGKQNITKNADLTKALESGTEEKIKSLANPILAAVIKNHLQYYDPRSPTQDFERTPIVLPNKKNELNNDGNCGTPHLKETPVDDLDDSNSQQYQLNSDMAPKNLCDGFFDMTLDETLKEQEVPLGSSTASQEAIENNISDLKSNCNKPAILETNFDYIQDDKNEEIGNVEDASSKILNSFKILENDPRSPSIGIERTPIVVTKPDGINNYVERMTDDILIKTLQSTNMGLRHTLSQDKNKDELLIYEDEVYDPVNLTPRKSVPEANAGYRTPLSCMKNKADCQHVRSKSANMFDPKAKNIQPSKRISHIPRLKSLAKTTNSTLASNGIPVISSSKTSVISGCENTPPNTHRDVWDKDNSVVL